MKATTGYTFDDVLLVPKHSKINSRSEIDLSVKFPKGLKLRLPLVSANMKSVTGVTMARTVARLGGLALLHRFDDYEQVVQSFCEANIPEITFGAVGASVGIHEWDFKLAKKLYKVGCRVLCVDVAHGDHTNVVSFVKNLREKYDDLMIIAGNVATLSGAQNLWNVGADVIKVGVGSGSTCTTRIETGNGYPQLSALDNICNGEFDETQSSPIFIADGGIRSAGDCVKSLCFADLVMVGNLFAGTDEAPGHIITFSGKSYKQYAGSSTHKTQHVEGVAGLVPYRGSVEDVIKHLEAGIRSGCSYQGVNKVRDLQIDPEFVIISNSGLKESHPHDIKL